MNRLLTTSFCIGSLTLLATSWQVEAVTPRGSESSNQDVKRVLIAESEHNVVTLNRRVELQPAIHPTTASDAEWWQAGFVKVGNAWVHAEVAHKQTNSKLLEEYRGLREASQKTPEGHLKLANWCHEHQLTDQQRAHLMQAIVQSPSKADCGPLYKRMGYRQIGQHWVSPDDLKEMQSKLRRDEKSMREWLPSMERIVRNWGANPKQHKQAQEELKGIEKPTAIPALLATSMVNETLAMAICEQLDEIPSFEASQALAAIAVHSNWRTVRQAATACLKDRKVDDFAPALLSALRTSLTATNPKGGVETPRLIFREEEDRYVAIDLRFLPGAEILLGEATMLRQRVLLPGFTASRGRTRLDDARLIGDVDHAIQMRVDEENDLTDEYNDRVAKVLSEVTGQESSLDPRYWWSWWDLHTGTVHPPKECITVCNEVQLPTRLVVMPDIGFRCSCLIAGTPIVTDRGLVAVERIQVGDRVLSKNIITGEVDFKAVYQTTSRDPVRVSRFTVGNTTIVASEAHHFWQSGTGWTKTRDLKTGDPVHTCAGMSRVTSTEAEPEPAPVYNLVVADFHTYFIGRDMILSHDVLQPLPTNTKVPGLEAE